MGLLIINEYGKDMREFRLAQDLTRIGRDPRSEIVLVDLGASRSHARILRKGGQFFLEDLGSRNGTLVNDRRVPGGGTCPLQNGDAIRIGRSVLRFILRISQKISSSLKKARDVVALEPTHMEARTQKREEPLSLFRMQNIEATLLIAEGGRTAVRYPLKSDRVRIGRDPKSNVVLSDPSVSGDHAEIVYNKEGFHVVDRDSTMGTFLDGTSVRVARLAHRSFLRFGKVQALLVIREEEREPPDPSFRLRDYLLELYPDRSDGIQAAFQACREHALDFAERLVFRGALSPEEWWVASSEFERRPGTRHRWISRFFRRG